MLQQLRDQTQSTGFKVLVIAIIAVLVFFGFGATNVFSVGDPEVAEVGDFAITENILGVETERERRRILGQMGPDFDPNDIDRLQLQQYALSQLINSQVLYQTAENLDLTVSADSVNQELLQSPAYQRDGQFDQALYLQQVQMLGYRPEEFIDEYANAMGSSQLQQGIQNSALLAEWEIAEIYSVMEQRRDVAYLPLLVDDYATTVTVSDAEVAERYEAAQGAYMTERKVDVEYLELSVDAVAAASSVEVSEDELRSMYVSDQDAAMEASERDSAHILFEVTDARDDAATLSLHVRSVGESIEVMISPNWQKSSQMILARAGRRCLRLIRQRRLRSDVRASIVGVSRTRDVSEPVRTEFGYHLIKLVAISESAYPTLPRSGTYYCSDCVVSRHLTLMPSCRKIERAAMTSAMLDRYSGSFCAESKAG